MDFHTRDESPGAQLGTKEFKPKDNEKKRGEPRGGGGGIAPQK